MVQVAKIVVLTVYAQKLKFKISCELWSACYDQQKRDSCYRLQIL